LFSFNLFIITYSQKENYLQETTAMNASIFLKASLTQKSKDNKTVDKQNKLNELRN